MMDEEVLMARAAWLYHVADLNQTATAKRLGITRARVNRLLAEARDCGLVSITINPSNVGLLPVEELIRTRYGLEFCICTPAFSEGQVPGAQGSQGWDVTVSDIEQRTMMPMTRYRPGWHSGRLALPLPRICAVISPKPLMPLSAPAGGALLNR